MCGFHVLEAPLVFGSRNISELQPLPQAALVSPSIEHYSTSTVILKIDFFTALSRCGSSSWEPAPAVMASHFDDDELSMSLTTPSRPSPASEHRAAQRQPSSGRSTELPRDPKDRKNDQRIGQYSIKKTLGEGSFGKVKLAVHRISGQEVALKIISRKKLISRDMAGRVEREIQYLQLLRHPHIIKL